MNISKSKCSFFAASTKVLATGLTSHISLMEHIFSEGLIASITGNITTYICVSHRTMSLVDQNVSVLAFHALSAYVYITCFLARVVCIASRIKLCLTSITTPDWIRFYQVAFDHSLFCHVLIEFHYCMASIASHLLLAWLDIV